MDFTLREKDILEALSDGERHLVGQLAYKLEMQSQQVSLMMRHMRRLKIVDCTIDSDDRRLRWYNLTQLGKIYVKMWRN